MCSIQPWLSVQDGAHAIEFYRSAFSATEVYRLDDPRGCIVARLAVQGAEFWVSGEPAEPSKTTSATDGDRRIRLILIVADPDSVFRQALAAGATEVFPVGEGHGWRLGRLVDPFGHHWEVGRPLGDDRSGD